MDAIYPIHLRGVADHFPPVPLLTKAAVDAVKPAQTLCQLLSLMCSAWITAWPALALGIKGRRKQKSRLLLRPVGTP